MVGFHDLRHFRASQWVMQGVDIRTVQERLGHQSITTTMRYAHYAPQHATQSIREVQEARSRKFRFGTGENRRENSEGEKENAISGGNPLNALMPKRGLEPPPPCED